MNEDFLYRLSQVNMPSQVAYYPPPPACLSFGKLCFAIMQERIVPSPNSIVCCEDGFHIVVKQGYWLVRNDGALLDTNGDQRDDNGYTVLAKKIVNRNTELGSMVTCDWDIAFEIKRYRQRIRGDQSTFKGTCELARQWPNSISNAALTATAARLFGELMTLATGLGLEFPSSGCKVHLDGSIFIPPQWEITPTARLCIRNCNVSIRSSTLCETIEAFLAGLPEEVNCVVDSPMK